MDLFGHYWSVSAWMTSHIYPEHLGRRRIADDSFFECERAIEIAQIARKWAQKIEIIH